MTRTSSRVTTAVTAPAETGETRADPLPTALSRLVPVPRPLHPAQAQPGDGRTDLAPNGAWDRLELIPVPPNRKKPLSGTTAHPHPVLGVHRLDLDASVAAAARIDGYAHLVRRPADGKGTWLRR